MKRYTPDKPRQAPPPPPLHLPSPPTFTALGRVPHPPPSNRSTGTGIKYLHAFSFSLTFLKVQYTVVTALDTIRASPISFNERQKEPLKQVLGFQTGTEGPSA